MSDLSAFITARLGEDEAAAKATSPSGERLSWRPDPTVPDDETAVYEYVISDPNPSGACLALGLERDTGHAVADHIARHDPARVLREVEAKRAIVREFTAVRKLADLTGADSGKYRDWVVRIVASAWSDHPDFDPAWKAT